MCEYSTCAIKYRDNARVGLTRTHLKVLPFATLCEIASAVRLDQKIQRDFDLAAFVHTHVRLDQERQRSLQLVAFVHTHESAVSNKLKKGQA